MFIHAVVTSKIGIFQVFKTKVKERLFAFFNIIIHPFSTFKHILNTKGVKNVFEGVKGLTGFCLKCGKSVPAWIFLEYMVTMPQTSCLYIYIYFLLALLGCSGFMLPQALCARALLSTTHPRHDDHVRHCRLLLPHTRVSTWWCWWRGDAERYTTGSSELLQHGEGVDNVIHKGQMTTFVTPSKQPF